MFGSPSKVNKVKFGDCGVCGKWNWGQFISPRKAYLLNLSLLLSIKPSKRFVVVVGGEWWWLRVTLMLSLGLGQAEELKPQGNILSYVGYRNSALHTI